jgi:hypothetical protein
MCAWIAVGQSCPLAGDLVPDMTFPIASPAGASYLATVHIAAITQWLDDR